MLWCHDGETHFQSRDALWLSGLTHDARETDGGWIWAHGSKRRHINVACLWVAGCDVMDGLKKMTPLLRRATKVPR